MKAIGNRRRRILAAALGLACLVAGPGALSAAGTGRPTVLHEWRFDADDSRAGAANAGANQPIKGRLFSTNLAAATVLNFAAVEADGRRNLDPRQGAVRLIFRPAWASRTSPGLPGPKDGPGPGHWARLFQAGDWDAANAGSAWLLAVDPTGTTLLLLTRAGAGPVRTNLMTSLNWRRPPARPGQPRPLARWHEIALNWRPDRTELILDGALVKDSRNRMFRGPALPTLPADVRCSLGSGPVGSTSADGWIREAVCYAAPISLLELAGFRARTALSAAVETAPPAVTLRWAGLNPAALTEIRRREAGQMEWSRLGSTTRFRWRDTDPALQTSRTYEYTVGDRQIVVPLAAPPKERRGRVLLLVDKKVARRLRSQLEQFERDLVGDGWTVRRSKVPRHDDDAWRHGPLNRRYRADLEEVKSLILAEHRAAPGGLAAVVLVGHVTIPYSGTTAEDGHPQHRGAWPADVFYGDVDARWTDGAARTPAAVTNPVLRNVPGDGKRDANTFADHIQASVPGNPPGIEIAVGRIDFANLPALRGRSEIKLLRAYFAKDHRYRVKQLTFAPVVAAGGFFYTPFSATGYGLYANALQAASRLFPEGAGAALLADAFGERTDCLWSMQGGYGAPDALHNNAQANRVQGTARYSTAWLADAGHEPRAGFHLLLGSYFGDWNLTHDNFLRACVALPHSGLAAVWARNQLWHFEPLGAGEPLGSMLLRTARGRASTRTTFLIGDPTLRMQITAPPGGLEARRRSGRVELAWQPSPEPGARYAVFRWSGEADEFPERLDPAPLAELRFTDSAATRAAKFYLVRALVPVVTGSGSFTNLSQAVFAPVR